MTTSPAQQVAANVRAEAARRRVPQSELARTLGMTQQSLSRRITGRVPFDVNELAAIAESLQIPIESLYGTTASAPA